eukprot:TRINITY_DN35589_c0_g1_i2.p2 TRINITY_DN35589_c0_g1~~TRINITY_DN35589_c0_g1_i2.p2  ORF type:complete len:177 (-),score=22.36 TRINITY_DN35589_c0_g1_i2:37-567(-)
MAVFCARNVCQVGFLHLAVLYVLDANLAGGLQKGLRRVTCAWEETTHGSHSEIAQSVRLGGIQNMKMAASIASNVTHTIFPQGEPAFALLARVAMQLLLAAQAAKSVPLTLRRSTEISYSAGCAPLASMPMGKNADLALPGKRRLLVLRAAISVKMAPGQTLAMGFVIHARLANTR